MRRKLKEKLPIKRWLVYGSLLAVCLYFLGYYGRLYKTANLPDPQLKFIKTISGKIGEEPVYNILKREGIREPELTKISLALKKFIDPKEFKPIDDYSLSLLISGKFHRLTITHGLERYHVAGVKGERVIPQKTRLPVFDQRREISGAIKSSLWDSMTAQGLSPQLAVELTDIFACNIDFVTEVRDGDKYSIIWDEKYTPEGSVLARTILAAYYEGSEAGKKQGYRFDGGYYSEKGESLQSMFLSAPLTFSRITSYFSARRFHPILKIFRAHFGIDYAAPTGTPVSSVASGRILRAGRNGGMGNYVEVAHSNGYVSGYGHLSRIVKGMTPGTHVKQGQIVGYVGSTGLASGPHLDFRMKDKGVYVNFRKLRNRAAESLSGARLAQFKQNAKALSQELKNINAGAAEGG
ncbi:MAG: M23 family metallopeptidase [Elusimicrobia bacterium]|nr:M23 family metallopeptidase [Elusimicrobiota bacterium]